MAHPELFQTYGMSHILQGYMRGDAPTPFPNSHRLCMKILYDRPISNCQGWDAAFSN